MATSTATILPGLDLVGTSSSSGEPPVTYTINGAVVGSDNTFDTSEATGIFFDSFNNPNDTITYVAKPSNNTILNATPQEATIFGERLINATRLVLNELASLANITNQEATFPPLLSEPETLTVESPEFDEDGNLIEVGQRTLDVPPIVQGPGDLSPELSEEELNDFNQDVADISTPGFLSNPDLDPVENELNISGRGLPQNRSDWRVRLSLSDDPSVNYLYRAPDPGILNPLKETNGVVFPYTPTISVNYMANYNPTELVHSNYKVFQYSSSSVDSITISCDFTAQDTYEANYLLAAIHFFRSATKMFYGLDENPRRGTPPPLCYIYGLGSYQFAGQPLAISQFTYNLPRTVDYIRTAPGNEFGDTNNSKSGKTLPDGVAPGGKPAPPSFTPLVEDDTESWVPSKIELSVTCVPMMNRNSVSNAFSFEEYATGRLLNGIGKRAGGFW